MNFNTSICEILRFSIFISPYRQGCGIVPKCKKLLIFPCVIDMIKVSKRFDTFILSKYGKERCIMSIGVIIFLIFLVVFAVLDLIMLLSLLIPGDERNQIIVWKASSFTLIAMIGANIFDIIESFIRSQPMSQNPLIQLEVAVTIYFPVLLFYKRKHSG